MTAIQLNAMNTELWQSIGAIADSEALMRRLTRYAKKLAKEREEDPTLMARAQASQSSFPSTAQGSGDARFPTSTALSTRSTTCR